LAAPALPTQHGGSVNERDALEVRVQARLKKGHAAGAKLVPRLGLTRRSLFNTSGDLLHQFPQHSLKQPLFAAEVMVQSAACDTAVGDDRLGGGLAEALLAEGSPRRRQDPGAGLLAPLGLRA